MSKQKLVTQPMWEQELDCGGTSLDGLLKFVLLGNVGNRQLVMATSMFTFFWLEAFLPRVSPNLVPMNRALKKLWGP